MLLNGYTPIANRTFESSKSTSSQSTGPRDFEFSSDGTKLFFCDGSNKRIHQYTMTTAWDVSTASHNGYYDVTGQISGGAFPISVQFKNDGTKMYVSTYAASPERIYEYDLGSAWIVTSGVTYNNKFGNTTVQAWGMEFNSTGTILICSSDSASGNLCKYTLSTAWDISTISLSQQVTLTSIKGIDLSPDGKQLLGAYFPAGNKKIISYSLSTAYDITTLTQREEWDVNSTENTLQTVTCKFDGSNKIDKLYFVGFQQDTIYGYDIDETADFIIKYNGTPTNVTYGYDGTPTNVSFVGTLFQPDLVWIKDRDINYAHQLYDTVRGATEKLHSNTTAAESTDSTGLTAFDSDGFTISTNAGINTNNNDYVAWCWKAGGTAVANTDGSITSSVSANQDAGFSIVSFTGTGSAGSVGHGLSEAPELIIMKNRDGTNGWVVRLSALGNGYLLLQGSGAYSSTAFWGNPTDSVFSFTSNSSGSILNNKHIAYCFHSVDGYQKIGSYSMTSGSAVSVDVGFVPRFVLLKETTRDAGWIIVDNQRNLSGNYKARIYPSSSSAESTGQQIQFIGNTFNINWGSTGNNHNGGTGIYLAIA